MVHHPHGRLGDAGGELVDLDAVELIDIDLGKGSGLQVQLARGIERLQHRDLEQAQFAIGDDQEVAAAAGRVEQVQACQLVLGGAQGRLAAPLEVQDAGQLGAQVVEEERLNDLQDILFGGVVGALLAALLGVHHRLEQGAEDGRADLLPAEAAGLEQALAHGSVEVGDRQDLGEEVAVDVGEAVEILVQALLPLVGRSVQHLEQVDQLGAQVRAVLGRAVLNVGLQQAQLIEDPGVVGEQAEQQAHQQPFQRMAVIAGCLQRVVKLAHQLGGDDVDRVLILEDTLFDADDEAERLDMIGQIRQGEPSFLACVQVDQMEGLEVADQNVARKLVVLQTREVV